jgi:hypothetical protein
MIRKKLPLGIQTFAKLREDDCYYVDKTGFALKLIEDGKYYTSHGHKLRFFEELEPQG